MKRIDLKESRTKYWNKTYEDLWFGTLYVGNFKVIQIPKGAQFQRVFRDQIDINLGRTIKGIREFTDIQ